MARMAVSFRPLPVITSVQLHPMDRWLACRLAETIAPARIRLELWNGWASPSVESPIGVLVVRDRRALIGLIVDPDLYFGECYMSQRVEILGDLEGVMRGLSGLRRPSQPSWRQKFALWATPSNGFVSARRNVHHHYDLGNDFYATWLDPELVYTCAYYPRRDASLEEAQATKLDLVCRKLRLRPGERVVEAGCGWGALSLHMARHYGVEASPSEITARFRSCFASAPPLAFPDAPRAGLPELECTWWKKLVQRVFEPWGPFPGFDDYFAELFSYFARPDAWELYPEVLETLATLKKRGLILDVISNFDSRLIGILEGLGACRYFDQIFISSRIGYAKPAREIFQAALDTHAVAAENIIHVGDSEEKDFRGAINAGFKAILIDRCSGPGTKPSCTIRTLKEIIPHVNDFSN